MMKDVVDVDSAVFPVAARAAQAETILVIDACPRERARTIEGLLLAGFRVASASSVADAFYTAVSVRPDLILVATAIPSSSGVELARQLKGDSRLREIPIVTYGDGAISEAVDASQSRFVVRAIHEGELVDALRARIHSPKPVRKVYVPVSATLPRRAQG